MSTRTVIRSKKLTAPAVLLHGLAGAAVGFLVLHPIGLLLAAAPVGVSQLLADPVATLFATRHLMMSGYFTAIGTAIGVTHAFYVAAIRRRATMIAMFESILPICCACKKIRAPGAAGDVQDNWKPLERYIAEETGTLLSHGVCPECSERLYPGL